MATSFNLLTGQKALVTDANFGIGQAVAIALDEVCADVVVNYIDGDAPPKPWSIKSENWSQRLCTQG